MFLIVIKTQDQICPPRNPLRAQVSVLKKGKIISYTVHQAPSHHQPSSAPANMEQEMLDSLQCDLKNGSDGKRVVVVSQTANVGETLEFLWEVVFIEHGISAVFDHLQGHGAEHRGELVYALRPGKKKKEAERRANA